MTSGVRADQPPCRLPIAVAALLLVTFGASSLASAQAVWGVGADSYRIQNRVAPDSCVAEDPETVVRYRKEPLGEVPAACAPERSPDVDAVKAVVKAYWAAPFVDQYGMFSTTYRETLARVFNVSGPEDYAKRLDPERIYIQQAYEQVELGTDAARVRVLATWAQEGYDGVQTYIFELVREGDSWKIAEMYY